MKHIEKRYFLLDGFPVVEESIFLKAGTHGIVEDDPRLVAIEDGGPEEWLLTITMNIMSDEQEYRTKAKKHPKNMKLRKGAVEITEQEYKQAVKDNEDQSKADKDVRDAAHAQKKLEKDAAKDRVKAKLVELGISQEDVDKLEL